MMISSKHSQRSKMDLEARDKVGDGEIVIMKDFAKKGENSRSQFERKVGSQERLIDETRQIIDGERRLKSLDGQQAGYGVREKMMDRGH